MRTDRALTRKAVTPSSPGQRRPFPELQAHFGGPFFVLQQNFLKIMRQTTTLAATGHRDVIWLAFGSTLGLKMNTKIAVYMKRMGFAAFMFFSLKGLAWIAVFYFGWNVIG